MNKDVLNIHVPKGTSLAIATDIHEHDYQFNKLCEKLQPSDKMWLYIAGDVYDKGFGKKSAEKIIKKIRELEEAGTGGMIRGNHELSNIRRAQLAGRMTKELEWVESQPLVRSFVFHNGSRVTIVHGGLTPKHTWSDFNVDVMTSFIKSVDETGESIPVFRERKPDGTSSYRLQKPGRSWHELYDGRFGYVVSGHDHQLDGRPKFYNYSCNIDTACYCTGILTSQVFDENGRKELISITGPIRTH